MARGVKVSPAWEVRVRLLRTEVVLRGERVAHDLVEATVGVRGAEPLAEQPEPRDVDLDDPPNCLSKFKSNRLFGWLVLGGLIGDLVSAAYG